MLNDSLKPYQKRLAQFAKERDWDQFHSPKNLAMAMSVECAELLEIFQWMKEEDSKKANSKEVRDELVDIMIYWLRIADKLNIDIESAFEEKFGENQKKYPADKVRGSSKKYTEY